MKNWPTAPQGPRPRSEGQEYPGIFQAQMEGVLSIGGALCLLGLKIAVQPGRRGSVVEH